MNITLKNNRILIVDDEPKNLKLLQVWLKRIGYDVSTAEDGLEGYEKARNVKPALIVSDLMMPKVDGIEFLKKIRADESLKDVIFILLTAKDTHESTVDGLLTGADDYITKPFDTEELLSRIKTNMRVSNNQDEIKEKKRELEDAYTKLKEAQSHLLHQEKMASIGQLAAGVAHEINNPIGFIMSNLNTLEKYINKTSDFVKEQSKAIEDLSCGAVKDAGIVLNRIQTKRQSLKLDYILEDIGNLIKESIDVTNRIKNIVQNLKSFSRLDEQAYKLNDINSGMDNTINIIWNEMKYKVLMKKEYGNIPLTKCNLGELNQVFMNVLLNAVQAIEAHGDITIRTWKDGGHIYISISDTGLGIPEEIKNRIFEPFFTTKDVGKGTGLGLSIAYDIIKKHHGEIKVDSEVGKGTVFTIKVPIIN